MPYRIFRLRIELDNDAMKDSDDLARALRQIAYKIDTVQDCEGIISDANGNKIGTHGIVTFKTKPPSN